MNNLDTKNTNYRSIALSLAAVGIILLGALWIWGNTRDQTGRDNQTNQETQPPGNNTGQIPGTGQTPGTGPQDETDGRIRSLTITAQNFSFNPNEIRVRQGDRIRLTLVSSQGLHDWVLDEFNARTSRVNSGQTTTIEFTANRTGTFEYYCSVGNHRQMGMVGKLIVE